MAGGLGYPELARAVIIANAELEKADARSLPDLGRAYSFNVGPRSYRKRLLPRLGRYLFRLRRRLSGP